MYQWLDRLYEKSKLYFALMWIGVYCIGNSLANPLSAAIGIDSSMALLCNGVLSAVLLLWLQKSNLMAFYGLCRSKLAAKRFLWYVPLLVFVSGNLWFGVGVNLPAVDSVCYILSMLCVGFLEEVIFRGLLFKALLKEGEKMAIIISSVTFGLGHILNLFNGSGMDLLTNLCQVAGAIACGFLFVVLFHRGGSLLPCIIAHSVNNAVSVFANESAFTPQNQLIFSVVITVIVVAYTLILCKTLPQAKEAATDMTQ